VHASLAVHEYLGVLQRASNCSDIGAPSITSCTAYLLTLRAMLGVNIACQRLAFHCSSCLASCNGDSDGAGIHSIAVVRRRRPAYARPTQIYWECVLRLSSHLVTAMAARHFCALKFDFICVVACVRPLAWHPKLTCYDSCCLRRVQLSSGSIRRVRAPSTCPTKDTFSVVSLSFSDWGLLSNTLSSGSSS